MYHDMGVLVYSGVSTEKVNKIGDLLKDAINPGLWLTTAPGGNTDAPFDKFTVYRLQTEEWHIDQSFRPKVCLKLNWFSSSSGADLFLFFSQRGSINIEGLVDLALKAVRQWTGHIMEKAKDVESLKDSFTLTEASLRITDDFANRGGVLIVSYITLPLERTDGKPT